MSRKNPGRKPVTAIDSDELSERGNYRRARRALGVMQHRLGQLDSMCAQADFVTGLNGEDVPPADEGRRFWLADRPGVGGIFQPDGDAELITDRYLEAALYSRSAPPVQVVRVKRRGLQS